MSDFVVQTPRKIDIRRHLDNDFEILQLRKEIEEIERHVDQQDRLQYMQPQIQNGELVIREPLPRGLVGLRDAEIRSLQIIDQQFTFDYSSQIGSLYFLKELSITGCNGLSDLEFLGSMQQLRRLSVTKCGLKNVNGVQYLKWVEEIDLSDNPVTSLKCLNENNQWRGMITLLNLSETKIQTSELSVLTNLSCQIETLDVSRTPIDSEYAASMYRLFDVFGQCRSVRYIQVTGKIISVDELALQSQKMLGSVSWTVRSFGLPPELEEQTQYETDKNTATTSKVSKSANIDIEALQNCSEAEFDRLLAAQATLPAAHEEPENDLRALVTRQQQQISVLTAENKQIKYQLSEMTRALESLYKAVSELYKPK